MFQKYFDNGYVPIPIVPMGKNPAIKTDWAKYCREKPSESLIEEWETRQPKEGLNIGITCGVASNVVVLDIDTDDEEVLNICPPSPVRRRGMKGEARFFKYNQDIKSQSYPGLDIMSDGRQILVPPSIHPITRKPYIWLTLDTLENMRSTDLPELDMSFLAILQPSLVRVRGLGGKPEGRNNKLVDIVSAMRGRGEPEEKIIKEVYDWDLKYHHPRLFNDPSDPQFKNAKNEQETLRNAWKFVNNVTQSLIKNGSEIISSGPELTIHVTDESILSQYKARTYPEPSGLIKDVRDIILNYSEREMPNIALGGAVSLMSVVCSNRFRFNETWTNTYVLNLAPTGSGKSFPQTIVGLLLNQYLGTTLSGFGNYQSSAAFTKNLVSRRERLDMIDEVSSLFAQMKGGGLWQTAILEEMCKLWSSSNGKYSASEYAEREDTSSCYNPCVSIFGSSTIEGIKAEINKMMTIKGLMPRFLIFSHENYGTQKDAFLDEGALKSVTIKLKRIIDTEKNVLKGTNDILQGPIYDPIDLAPLNEDAVSYFKALRREFSDRVEKEDSEPLKSMLTRGKEQVMKLATIHAAGCFRAIELDDLVWAKGVWDVSFHNCTPLIEETAVENSFEKSVQQMGNIIKRQKSGFITHAVLMGRMKRDSKEMLRLIDYLIETGQIVKSASPGYNKPGYSWANKS